MPKKHKPKHAKPRAAATIGSAGEGTPSRGVWEEFFEFVRGIDIAEDWMKDRPMNRISSVDRTYFSEDD